MSTEETPGKTFCTLAVIGLIALTACQPDGDRKTGTGEPDSDTPVVTESAGTEVSAENAEWPSFGRTGSEQHFSPLDQVNTGTVDRLSLAWYFDLPAENSMTGPVMADGKVFTTTGHSHIRALDATTGRLLWEYDPKAREVAGYRLRFGYGSKGLAYGNGRVFIATHDGRVIALDADNGEPAWENRTVEEAEVRQFARAESQDVKDHRYVNGPPRFFDGKLVIGHAGADVAPARGYVDCFDANTGKRLWRFYTVPGNPADGFENDAMKLAAATWHGEWWRWGGGGTVWNAVSYDPELNHFYLGAGNGFPYNHEMRSEGEGDNLFLSSIVAVDADSGEYIWHYQTTPAEHTDYNASMDMTLATLTIDGRERKVLMQAPKNGFFYVIDRTNGELISAKPFARVTWATQVDPETGRPVEVPGYRYHDKDFFELWPSVAGAHSWQPQSFSPETGLVYLPVIERASLVGDKGLDLNSPQAGTGLIGDFNLNVPGTRKSFLKAWDPIAQKARWQVETPGDWPGGTMATAGDLVFQGRVDGRFIAYNARTGEEAWTFSAGVPVLAPPISYAVDGRQYILVLTGSGTSGGGMATEGLAGFRTDYRLPRRVLAFALDGGAKLPPSPPRPAMVALEDPDYKSDPELEARGAREFAMFICLVCHGTHAVAGGVAPDLRISPYITKRDAFHAVVREGALVNRGMPQFPEMSETQAEAIRQYLRARSRELPETDSIDNSDSE